jgi:hypothetical protein
MEPKNGGSTLITTFNLHSYAKGMIRNRSDCFRPLQGRSEDTTQGAHLAEAQMSMPITIYSTPPDHVRSITSSYTESSTYMKESRIVSEHHSPTMHDDGTLSYMHNAARWKACTHYMHKMVPCAPAIAAIARQRTCSLDSLLNRFLYPASPYTWNTGHQNVSRDICASCTTICSNGMAYRTASECKGHRFQLWQDTSNISDLPGIRSTSKIPPQMLHIARDEGAKYKSAMVFHVSQTEHKVDT